METPQFDSVDYHFEVAGNIQKLCENMLVWITNKGLLKEQIISISTHETSVESGDPTSVIVYKKKQEPSMGSLSNLKFHIIRNTAPWQEQFDQAMKIALTRCEVIALTHTPRNIGQMNVQVMWYLPSNQSYHCRTKHFSNDQADWETLLKQTMEYLNTYIAPHELLSFSIFEDDHPCNNRLCHALVTHKGSDSTPLIKGEEIKGDVFKLKIYRQNSTWEDLLRLLSSDIEKLGIDQYRVQVATSNSSEGDSQLLALIYWNKTHEDALADISRGGCCSIF